MKVNFDSVRSIQKLQINTNKNNVFSSSDFSKNNCKNLTSAYYPIPFMRNWKEHKSWGAQYSDLGTTFRLFTFPDVRHVSVVVLSPDKKRKNEIALENHGNGVFETKSPVKHDIAKPSDSYYYSITTKDGKKVDVKDPYSYKQDELMNESVIYNQNAFIWGDGEKKWKQNPCRISRTSNGKHLKVENAKIFEINPATYERSGNLQGVIKKLNEVKRNGFNTIEIMPVENTPSINWGYDGVDKFAVAKYLGGPDGLKNLVKSAHSMGLNVIMDMVPNHLGPIGAQLQKTGPYIGGDGAFGAKFNFENENSKYVRDYMVNAALNWLDNYHCDGLRFDMTGYMESDYTLKEMVSEINYHFPEAFVIAEDGREDKKITSQLTQSDYGGNDIHHNKCIERIDNQVEQLIHAKKNNSPPNIHIPAIGCDSKWAFEYMHALNEMLYESNRNIEYLMDNCIRGKKLTKYVMSHDEIGNHEGTRLVAKLMVPILDINNKLRLFNEDYGRAESFAKLKNNSYNDSIKAIRCQKAQLVSEKLAMMIQTGEIENYLNGNDAIKFKEKLNNLGLDGISPEEIMSAFNTAYSKSKMATAFTYTLNGPKMIFQGDENSSLTPFRFFREGIDDNPENLTIEKGYKSGRSAYNESKIDTAKYGGKGIEYTNAYLELIKKLNRLAESNPAMDCGEIIKSSSVAHNNSKLLAIHQKYKSNEIYTIANFKNQNYKTKSDLNTGYKIDFPEGKWQVILNTDDKKYLGSGMCEFPTIIGGKSVRIDIPACSTIIFKKVG